MDIYLSSPQDRYSWLGLGLGLGLFSHQCSMNELQHFATTGTQNGKTPYPRHTQPPDSS